ncbi:MAG TPA: hypothetical protein VK559_13335 [Ferruginibacter sp.]|nr:hypothetical protein [Ferruginibacter sp.]
MKYFLLTITVFITIVMFSSCKKSSSSTKPNNNDSITKLSQFFTVTVNDTSTYNYGNNPGDSLGYYDYDTTLDISAWHYGYDSEFDLEFKTPTIVVGSNESLDWFDLQGSEGFYGTPTSPLYVKITEYGAVGQYVSGNFAGTIYDSYNSKNYKLSGSFRIKRAPYDPPY